MSNDRKNPLQDYCRILMFLSGLVLIFAQLMWVLHWHYHKSLWYVLASPVSIIFQVNSLNRTMATFLSVHILSMIFSFIFCLFTPSNCKAVDNKFIRIITTIWKICGFIAIALYILSLIFKTLLTIVAIILVICILGSLPVVITI